MREFKVTEAQVADFHSDGFIQVDRIISDESVALLRERFDKLFAEEYETGIAPDEVNWQVDRDPPENTRQLCNAWKSDRGVARVILGSDIGRACATLGGWPGARISQDNLLWKPPGGKPLGFHQDSAYEQWTAIPDWASCWIALDDTTAEGGTVEYVRGSHRWGQSGKIDQFHAPTNPIKELSAAADAAGIESPERVPIVVKAGGGAFHQGWTWHGSDINHTQRPRRSIVAHCMSSENKFHSEFVSSIYSRYKKFGTVEMDESFFPIIWRLDGYRSEFLEKYSANNPTRGT